MERLTNIGSNGEVWITDNDYTMAHGRKESAFAKLAEYEDLEDRLHGISIKQVVDGFIKTAENLTHEGYENGRILTNEDAEEWNEYKNAEEQGLLLKPPCKVGDTVFCIEDEKVWDCLVEKISISRNNGLWIEVSTPESMPDICAIRYTENDFGKTVFLTQSEAEQKLKEMESD